MTTVLAHEHSERFDAFMLEQLATEAAEEFEGRDPLLVLEWAARTFGPRLAVTSSMNDSVIPHLASRVAPGINVLFVDTGYHFAETIGMAQAMPVMIPVNVVTVRAPLTKAEHEAKHGELWRRDPDACCRMRKVEPLERAMRDYDAWVTGIRRAEAPSRRNARIVEWDDRRKKVKINPIVAWTDDDVQRYAEFFGLLDNPLKEVGYLSIGCAPCTRAVAPGEDPRSGRWAGRQKTECGIHL